MSGPHLRRPWATVGGVGVGAGSEAEAVCSGYAVLMGSATLSDELESSRWSCNCAPISAWRSIICWEAWRPERVLAAIEQAAGAETVAIIDLTATPYRNDECSMLSFLPVCAFARTNPEMVQEVYLAPPHPHARASP